MFPEMRRKGQLLSREESEVVLRDGTSGVLALLGAEGYPYAVPLSYVYSEGNIYFHCAKSGHKLDAIWACEKASFCVIDQDEILPEKFTTAYRSVIAFGTVCILEGEPEIRHALGLLCEKYAPGDTDGRDREMDKYGTRLCMLAFSVSHLTGKQGLELVKGKEQTK